MATNTEVNVRINVDAKGADTSVGSIKKQLKDATNELITMREKFGESSAEAVNAAKKVANLKDAIGDAKAMTDAFDPDAKFKAFGSALQGVAGGFAALQGAQALFGSESEDVAKVLAKVQGAMALSQGINSILQAKDAFTNLKSVALDAFNSLKSAIGGLGIGLLVAGLGLLIAKWDDIKNAIIGVSDEQRMLNETMDAYQQAAQGAIQKTDEVKTAFDLAKKGVITKEEALKKYNSTLGDAFGQASNLNEAEKLFAQKTGAYIQSVSLRAQADELLKIAAQKQAEILSQRIKRENASSSGGLASFLKIDKAVTYIGDKQIEQKEKEANAYTSYAEKLIEQSEEINKQNKIANEDQIKSNKETASENERIAKEAAAEQKRKNQEKLQEAEQLRQKIKDLNKQYDEQEKKLAEENYLQSIKDEDFRQKEKLRIDYENKQKEIENSIAGETQKSALLKQLKIKYEADVKTVEDASAKKAEEKRKEDEAKALEQRQKQIDFENETFNMQNNARIERIKNEQIKAQEQEAIKYQNEIDAALDALNKKEITAEEYAKRREAIETNHNNALLDINTAAIAAQKAQDEARYQAKIAQFQEIGSLAQQLSGIIGETTAVGKALALSQIAIDTGVAISSLTRNSEANTLNAPTGGVAGAIQFATGLIRILANIKKAKDLLSQAKVPAKGAGGGVNLPSGGGATIAPIAPTLNTTMLNQGQINQLSSATARAYVVESDVTGSQERIQRLNRAARIN